MTVFFVGSEPQDFDVANVVNDVAGTVNRGAIQISSDNSPLATATALFTAPTSNLWCKFTMYYDPPGSGTGTVAWTLQSGANGILRVASTSGTGGGSLLQYWNGSTWVSIGDFQTVNLQWITYDVYVKIAVAGEVRAYKNGVPILELLNVNLTAGGTITSVDRTVHASHSVTSLASGWTYFSAVLCADWNTLSARVVALTPTANGNYTAWTGGTYTDIDEVVRDGVQLTSSTVDERESFAMGDVSLVTGESIQAVRIAALVGRDASGPQAVELFVRSSGGTDYAGTDTTANLISSGITRLMETDPATSAPWSQANLNAVEFGIRSRP